MNSAYYGHCPKCGQPSTSGGFLCGCKQGNQYDIHRECNRLIPVLTQRVTEQRERIAALEAKLAEISGWCDAYPFDIAGGIFNEPDMGEVQRLLGNDLLTKLSASNYRHVLNGIKRIIEGRI